MYCFNVNLSWKSISLSTAFKNSMKNKSFLAFDIGATSGRSILGTLDNGRLQMKELTRFPNQMLQIGNHFHWNIYSLFEHLKAALVAVKKEGVEISSIGIDTWGVDFALIAKDGSVLGAPYAYRDPHTEGAPEKFFSITIACHCSSILFI